MLKRNNPPPRLILHEHSWTQVSSSPFILYASSLSKKIHPTAVTFSSNIAYLIDKISTYTPAWFERFQMASLPTECFYETKSFQRVHEVCEGKVWSLSTLLIQIRNSATYRAFTQNLEAWLLKNWMCEHSHSQIIFSMKHLWENVSCFVSSIIILSTSQLLCKAKWTPRLLHTTQKSAWWL